MTPDRRRRRCLPALVGAAALSCLVAAIAAVPSGGNVQVAGDNLRTNMRGEDSMLLDKVTLRQTPNTRITADKAEGTRLSDNNNNGRWNLTGNVHVEHNDTILDANNAVVVFAGGRLQSVEVQGGPARFSHPAANKGPRNQGRADRINFDAVNRRVRFTGRVSYSFGRDQGNSDTPLLYDLGTDILSSVDGDDASARVRFMLSGNIEVDGRNWKSNINQGTTQMDDVVLRQPPDTVIRAERFEGSQLAGGKDNATWNLSGKVHVEYSSMILDADTAVAALADGKIRTIEVKGAPANFSHPSKTAGQRNLGSAETIQYDATTREVRFTGRTWYSMGPYEGNAEKPLVYSLDTSTLRNEPDNSSRVRFTFHPDQRERVPTPRTPERSTAQ